MSQYDDWFVPSLDTELMRSGAIQRQAPACLYISDVHKLAENDCLLLRQLAAQFPGLKWFIIGGSPCQDLTYAGYLHSLLGLESSFPPSSFGHTYFPDFSWQFFCTFPC